MSRRVLLACLAALVAAPALAQSVSPPMAPPSRIEVRAAGVWTPGTTGGTVQSDYAPLLVNGTGTGTSSQTLSIDSDGALGYEFGTRIRLSTHAGVELAFGRVESSLSGINGPARLSLEYVSRQPPNYEPRTYRVEEQTAVPDTEGERTETMVLAGVSAQWDQRCGPVGGSISGGISLRRLTGPIRRLVYTEYRLGGHSTLFSSQHGIEIEPDPDWFLGPYVAAELRLRLAARARLIGGARLHLGSGTWPLHGRPTRVIDAGEDTFPPDLQTVTTVMGTPSISASVARWQVFAGVAFVVK